MKPARAKWQASSTDLRCQRPFLPVASLDFFVNVWNCQAELYLAHGSDCTSAEEVLELDAEALEELLDRVVYDDNDGAINISGQYFPQSEESLALFSRLTSSARPKVKALDG